MYDWATGGFGVYVHWPFCQSKCPYCDFNSHVVSAINQDDWCKAYLSEIDRYADEVGGRTLQTIYFGGGTPSLMNPDLVFSIIEKIRSRWNTVNDLEVTLEANPGSVEAARFKDFNHAGVNRVSIGVQALDDNALQRLGRLHSKKDALRALDIAKSTFGRVSFDLIYARQDQSLADWRNELTEALTLAGDHLSLYQLTVEDGTAFAERAARGGLRGLPPEDLAADMYELTQDLCGSAGLPAYEVSNHAKPGEESRHNMIYWRAGDYVGIGPGAHGRLTKPNGRFATESSRAPTDWLSSVSKIESGESLRSQLSEAEMALEYLLMSLRTSEGLDIFRYHAIAEKPLDKTVVANLIDLNLVLHTEDRLIVTQKGRLLLNGILRDLAPN